jgi:hypothetical protein
MRDSNPHSKILFENEHRTGGGQHIVVAKADRVRLVAVRWDQRMDTVLPQTKGGCSNTAVCGVGDGWIGAEAPGLCGYVSACRCERKENVSILVGTPQMQSKWSK